MRLHDIFFVEMLENTTFLEYNISIPILLMDGTNYFLYFMGEMEKVRKLYLVNYPRPKGHGLVTAQS